MKLNATDALKKWEPILEAKEAPSFSDEYRKAVTAVVLENTEEALIEQAQHEKFQLNEAAPANNTGNVQGYDPVLISLVRRTMPNLIAYDIAGVQPMTGPTGLIFALKPNYQTARAGVTVGADAFFNEPQAGFSGDGVAAGADSSSLPAVTTAGALESGAGTTDTNADTVHDSFATGSGMTTATGEVLGDAPTNPIPEMGFTIAKTTVTAETRALKAEYTMELAQDLKAIHGLNAEAELSNILAGEITAEMNRELVRTVNASAKLGCQDTTNAGVFDMNVDADGRWSIEKVKGLILRIQREANQIAVETRRGKGNIVICSANVAAALSAAGMLDYASAVAGKIDIKSDVTGTTFVGMLPGGIKVYLDPYAGVDYVTVGYKGANAYDAGIFYCPYQPLVKTRAVGENTMQPKIAFRTRAGVGVNPMVGTAIANRVNTYYRIFRVINI